ncbi:MAG: hypothetical protein K0S23_1475 [Fluviicola sp.]|jgi:hypothetical protein|uniref:hypothetical protein n=1 Tax=Fluviicola sp. TaxID=1917219 RepID=UPI00262924E0|nr:hypothetical protein [Fluviicola sp.]MDF3027168.1 hypothetical protein [Fluviicola sp.]
MLAILIIIGVFLLCYLFIKWRLKRNISVHRIHFESINVLQTKSNDPLVQAERHLRKTAYAEVQMIRTEAFYTDEDMGAAFDFIVVRDRKTKTPLLSSRSYTDQRLISKQLQPHETTDYLTLSLVPDEPYVFLDRLSGNSAHPLFTNMRQRIFMNYYLRVLNSYPKHHIILMARSSLDERLLTKYLRLGFHVVGKQKHHQADHWIVILPAKSRTQGLAQSAKQYVSFKLFS